MTTYPGGKNVTFRNIINEAPPHDIYLEPFVGSGAVLMNKKIAPMFSIGIDQDGRALNQIMVQGPKPFKVMTMNIDPYNNMMGQKRYMPGACCLHLGDALFWMSNYHDMIIANHPKATVWCYLDPPYLEKDEDGTPIRQGNIYKHEFQTLEQHADLLGLIKQLPWKIAISGYASELYERELKDWRKISWEAITRAGTKATEYLWMNYEQPFELHDYQYLGKGFRDREKIRRQQKRWDTKLKNMRPQQRYAMMSVIEKHRPGAKP